MPQRSQQGLENFMGFLCYRHSLLQAILHLPKLVNFLILYHQPSNCVSDNSCLSCLLRTLAEGYWRGSSSKELSKVLRSLHSLFGKLGWSTDTANSQGDPEEQLGWIVGKMEGELPAS